VSVAPYMWNTENLLSQLFFPSILPSGFSILDVLKVALSQIEILSFSWCLLKPFSSTSAKSPYQQWIYFGSGLSHSLYLLL